MNHGVKLLPLNALLLLALGGCIAPKGGAGANGSGGGQSQSCALTAPFKPQKIVIAPTAPLEFSVQLRDAGTAPSGWSLRSNRVGILPGLGALTPSAGGGTFYDASVNVSSPVTVEYEGLLPHDATLDTRVSISISGGDASLAEGQCDALGSYSSLQCDVSGFSLRTSELVSGTLSIRYADPAADTLVSNGIPTSRYIVRQISALRTALLGDWSVFDSRLYFRARASTGGDKLFAYADTTRGIRQLLDMMGAGTGDSVRILGYYNGGLYLSSLNTPIQRKLKLFRYLADDDSITPISEIRIGDDDAPLKFFVHGGCAYFSALTTTGVRKLFRYREDAWHGSMSLVQLTDLAGPAASDDPDSLVSHLGKLYFVASTGPGIRKVFSYDDTGTGRLERVSNLAGDAASDEPGSLTSCGGSLYVVARNAHGALKLMRHDPTSRIFRQLSNTAGAHGTDDSPSLLTCASGTLYFSAFDNRGAKKLFKVAASPERLVRIGDEAPEELLELGTNIYYVAAKANGARKVFAYDPVNDKVRQVSNTREDDTADDSPAQLTAYAGKLYFKSTQTNAGAPRLFVYNPAADTLSNAASVEQASVAAVYGSRLYFTGTGADGFSELYSLCDLAAGCTEPN